MEEKNSENKIINYHNGNIKKIILKESNNNKIPSKGNKVIVHYTGFLKKTGKKFDSSLDRNEPFEFILGQGDVIKGWDIGVATMKLGETSKFILSAEYAYGLSGSLPLIPPNSILIFEITLLSFDFLNLINKSCYKEILKRSDDLNKNEYANDLSTIIFLEKNLEKNSNSEKKVEINYEISNILDSKVDFDFQEALQSMKINEEAIIFIFDDKKVNFTKKSLENFSKNFSEKNNLQHLIKKVHIKIIKIDNKIDLWSTTNLEKLNFVVKLKENSNLYFKKKFFFQSLKKYNNCLDILEGIHISTEENSSSNENAEKEAEKEAEADKAEKKKEEEKKGYVFVEKKIQNSEHINSEHINSEHINSEKNLKNLKKKILNNIATCYYKLKDYKQCLEITNRVLNTLDSENIKSLIFKGKILHLINEYKDYENSLLIFQKVEKKINESESESQSESTKKLQTVKKFIQANKIKIKKKKNKERKLYKNMFSKINLKYDDVNSSDKIQ